MVFLQREKCIYKIYSCDFHNYNAPSNMVRFWISGFRKRSIITHRTLANLSRWTLLGRKKYGNAIVRAYSCVSPHFANIAYN